MLHRPRETQPTRRPHHLLILLILVQRCRKSAVTSQLWDPNHPMEIPVIERAQITNHQSSRRINQQQSIELKGLKRPASPYETDCPARRKTRSSHRHEHPVSSSDSAAPSRTRLRQHQKWKRPPSTEPPVITRKPQTSTFRPPARKRKLSSAILTTRGHVKKVIVVPSASSRTSIPRHNYKTRLQAQRSGRPESTPLFQSPEERQFVQ